MAELRGLRETIAQILAEAGVPDAAVDAELLLAHVLGVSRGELQSKIALGESLPEPLRGPLDALVARRAAREPLQHLTGVAPFRSLELQIGPGAFVPRPETELVAQFAIDALAAVAGPAPIGVDLGTGSGAIALALATEVPHARVYAVERSPEAHAWAARNIAALAPGVTLVLGDLAGALAELDGTVDVVISNPPYIPDDAVPVYPEVHLHDPPAALYGGPDGLDAVRAVAATAHRLLRAGGTLVIEHGEAQAGAIAAILSTSGFTAIASHRDLTGRDRATTALR